jgi:hypothetical protein
MNHDLVLARPLADLDGIVRMVVAVMMVVAMIMVVIRVMSVAMWIGGCHVVS